MNADAQTPQPSPTLSADQHEAIRQRAEEIYIRNGRIPGRDMENWAQAEQEILCESAKPSWSKWTARNILASTTPNRRTATFPASLARAPLSRSASRATKCLSNAPTAKYWRLPSSRRSAENPKRFAA